MRNKKYVWPMALALVLLLSACGSADGTKSRAGGSQTKSVNEVLASGQQAAESQKAARASSETGASLLSSTTRLAAVTSTVSDDALAAF